MNLRYLLVLLALSANGQQVPTTPQTNTLATNTVARVSYSRFNLRDKATWALLVQDIKTNRATAWSQYWAKMWGWRYSTSTNTSTATNQINNATPTQPIAPVNQPTNNVPVPVNQQATPLQVGMAIDNLNSTIWRNSGWKVVNPYESLLRDYRLAARGQRDYAQTPIQFNNQIPNQLPNQMFQSSGQINNYNNQPGGLYGNSYSMGVPNNLPSTGNSYLFPSGLGYNYSGNEAFAPGNYRRDIVPYF